jgi:hypothetical protein
VLNNVHKNKNKSPLLVAGRKKSKDAHIPTLAGGKKRPTIYIGYS